jgi:4-hydroxysphinganine ceramide fatty acyl 2-hydroxylase
MRRRIQLFENPLLERLTRARPGTVVLVWGSVVTWLLLTAPLTPALLAWIPAGWLAWTLYEYWMHRVLFHWPAKAAWSRRMVFVVHGCHHADPQDPERAVMPPAAAAPYALAVWGVCALALPEPADNVFFAGFLAGYLHYDLTHWACHQARPRTRWGQMVRLHHLRHHAPGANGNYGVSTPLWDHVFRTVMGKESRLA